MNEWIERASCRGWKLYIRETVSDKSSGQHNWSKSYVLRQIPSTSVTVSGRPVTSEMICRADVICHVSSYHIFLIGGYQFSVFLIDSSNRDTLSAVYSSLIAGQTLLKCQYLLFFLEHHFQKDCNSFGDTSLLFNAQGVRIQTKSSFYYSLPLLWSQGWPDLPATMAALGSSTNVPIGCCYWQLVHNVISTSSDELCNLGKDNLQWFGPLMVKALDPSLLAMAVDSPMWVLGSRPFGFTWTKLWPKVQTWNNKEPFCCHGTAWL